MWQRMILGNAGGPTADGPPQAGLPEVIATWADYDPTYVYDLTGKAPQEFGFDSVGFWPVVVQMPQGFNVGAQVYDGTWTVVGVDAEGHRVTETPGLRSMNAEELEAFRAPLVEFANQWQWAYATGGFRTSVGGTLVEFGTDEGSLGLMTGKAVRFQQPGAPGSVRWQTGATEFVTIGAGDFIALAAAIADFVQATFGVLETVLDGIQGGSVVTQEAIMGAGWPANGE